MDKIVYLPSTAKYTIEDADAYIRSALVIPKKAEAYQDLTWYSADVLVIQYVHNGESIDRFICYPMSAYKTK